MQLWLTKNGTVLRNMQSSSISNGFNEASSAGKPLFLFERMITSASCCGLFVQNYGTQSSVDTVVAGLIMAFGTTECLKTSSPITSSGLPFCPSKSP